MKTRAAFCRIGPCVNAVEPSSAHLGTCSVHRSGWRTSEEYQLWRKRLAEDPDAPEAKYQGWLLRYVRRVEAEMRASQ